MLNLFKFKASFKIINSIRPEIKIVNSEENLNF